MTRFNKIKRVKPKPERLAWAAIIRDGVTHGEGFREHARIRGKLGDQDPYAKRPGDQEGFLTDKGRFLTRGEAVAVGVYAGQLQPSWVTVRRDLLSSDIDWSASK